MSILFVVMAAASAGSHAQPIKSKAVSARSQAELKLSMRTLWEDHVSYTRNYIISALAGLGDTSNVAERLLKNQDDIGDAIKPFYGIEAGNKLSALLRDHILMATDVVQAARMGNREELSMASQKWYANADAIAAFLSNLNPGWARSALEDMLHKHLEFTNRELVSRLEKNWVADIQAYDNGHAHVLMFADVLTNGIVKQFPARFRK
jgi:hypothetical protein